jgi:hypothetical protein
MTDFDEQLRQRLARLEQAVPVGSLPQAQIRSFSARRRGYVWLLLAATIALLMAGTLVATASRPPRTPAEQAKDAADEERVRNDLASQMTAPCLSVGEAQRLIRSRLNALALTDWTIRQDDTVSQAPCVTAAPVGDSHEVLLIPSFGTAAGRALDSAASSLMSRCLNQDQARDLLRSALIGAGIPSPRIEVGGVRGIPLEYGDRYVKHVQEGCYVYAGAQFDSQGRYTWYLAGP